MNALVYHTGGKRHNALVRCIFISRIQVNVVVFLRCPES